MKNNRSKKPAEASQTQQDAVAASTPVESNETVKGGLSEMTQRLLDKASELSRTINATATARFEASEEFMMSLVDGSVSIPDLITRYGLTDSVTGQKQLLELEQLGTSIRISIAQKDVQILALKDQRKTLQISEQEAKLSGQIHDTADAIDNARHKEVMTLFKAQIRSHQERGKGAQVTIEKHQADKKCIKRDGILSAMRGVKAQKEGQPATSTPQVGDRQTTKQPVKA